MLLPLVIAGLTAVASATLSALVFALLRTRFGDGAGLSAPLAWAALGFGALLGVTAFQQTRRLIAARESQRAVTGWGWLTLLAFAFFAVRAFCWLLYWDGDKVKILSPNNLGDLSRHLLYARLFAAGAPWWPAHPLHAWATLRYYPGIDLFQSLLLAVGADERRALVWVGLAGAAATAAALRRWGGTFALAAFLFNGGLAGFQLLGTGRWLDYQGPLAWKSLPLAIFVTQRGFLFALPAGLLLLAHWRETLFGRRSAEGGLRNEEIATPLPSANLQSAIRNPHLLLPFWVEALLYVALPFFQLYAFLFMSGLLGWWLVVYIHRAEVRRHVPRLLAVALLPVTGEVALMTGGFERAHSLWLKLGWMQDGQAFWKFWPLNFGLALPLAAGLWLWLCARRLARDDESAADEAAEAFVLPAGVAFLTTCVVMFAPWEWDNTKLMLWSYLAAAPFVWELALARRPLAVRAAACAVLFFSGFVSLVGGLGSKHQGGYELARRSELDAVRAAVGAVPITERFACSPDYSHPLVLSGRMVAMGYDGALFAYGLEYRELQKTLGTLMLGRTGWEEAARRLGARYVYWGPREEKRFPGSTRPWEAGREPLASGKWGAIYDLASARAATSAVRSMSSAVCAVEMKPASNCEGAR